MVKFKPFLLLPLFPIFHKSSFKLVAGLICLSFFLSYHPVSGFPPVAKNTAYAKELPQQTQIVESQKSPVEFQLPHPGYITTPFSNYHPGIDLCSGLGLPIKPIAKGVVVETGYNFFGLGLVVEVDHGNGYRSLYAHMGKIYVSQGQTVEANNFLGEIGMTGHTSGPHTHLEISKDGKKVDPLSLLPEIRKYPTDQDFISQSSATPSAILIPTLPVKVEPTPTPSQTPSPEEKLVKTLTLNPQKMTAPKLPDLIINPLLLKTEPSVPNGGSYYLTLKSFLKI